FLTAADRRQLRLIDAGAEREIYRRPRTNNFGTETFGDKRNIRDVIGVTMAGKDIVSAANHAQDSFFVGLPLFVGNGLLAREKRVDQDLALTVDDLPSRCAKPLQSDATGIRRRGAGLGFRRLH